MFYRHNVICFFPAALLSIARHRTVTEVCAVDPHPHFLELLAQRRTTLRAELTHLIKNPGAIVWEVGCGHGHFLVDYAAKQPTKFCLGVDITQERIERGQKKSSRAKLANCYFVRCEAREFLLALPTGATLEEIWVLFPDPWPKKRHHKNRIMQPDFLEQVANRAGQGARLYFRTDHEEYFQAVASMLPEIKTWVRAPADQEFWPADLATVFQARAPSYRSLVAIRTLDPAKPIVTTAPGLPRPVEPTSLA